MATDDLTLAAEFDAATYDDWRKLAEGVLKGAPFDRLVGKTYDGLTIDPIYRRAQNAAPVAGRAPAQMWRIMQRVDHPDAKAANAQALHDLENGADGLVLVFAGSAAARGFGLPHDEAAITQALDGVFLDAGIAIDLELGAASHGAAPVLADIIRHKGLKPADCDIRFGLDPIGAAAIAGDAVPDLAATIDAAKKLKAAGFNGPFFAVDGRAVHDAGGSEVQELAFVLASGVACLRALEQSGVGPDDARAMISMRLAADADQFLTLAKCRALRQVWARVEESCGLTPKPLFVSADTAWRMLTQRDPFVNMLRATMATFAAGLGGVNAITVLPHTLALGLPDGFARRAARNTQLVLLHESNLAKVSDPAAGAGGIEALTSELCAAAWTSFQSIESAGGVSAALEQGAIQSAVAATRAARDSDLARRRRVLTGASEFPNLHEAEAKVLRQAPQARSDARPAHAPLTPVRLAAPFEALRDRSDAMRAKTGSRPKVLLATLGTPADFTARATFAKSFFETGGIAAVEVRTDDVAEAFRSSGAAIACLCSSDKLYATHAADAARALRAAGCTHIYLAGRPGDLEAELRAAGVGGFVFAGIDAVKALEDIYEAMA